ncbi:MAG: DUF3443 family protein [Steroidobacteraceae bacterium]
MHARTLSPPDRARALCVGENSRIQALDRARALNAFDFGLPFFYGRSLYVAFEAGIQRGKFAASWIGFQEPV